MQIHIRIDDLKLIATLSTEAAEIMNDANKVIDSIVSKHDWKCPERDSVDEMLDRLKANAKVINQVFSVFSSDLVMKANNYIDIINDRERDKAKYMDDIMSRVSTFGSANMTKKVAFGQKTESAVEALESSSVNISNISSLHGATHGISIIDFNLFSNL